MWSTTFCSLFLSSCWSVFGCTAKQWKRMITKATFVGPSFTRKPPKYERFIRPSGLRFTKAHVTHPELKCTFNLEIIGVKKNPNGPMYTSLGVMTKGTIIEVISTCNSSNNSFIYLISNAYHLNFALWILGERQWTWSGHPCRKSCMGYVQPSKYFSWMNLGRSRLFHLLFISYHLMVAKRR